MHKCSPVSSDDFHWLARHECRKERNQGLGEQTEATNGLQSQFTKKKTNQCSAPLICSQQSNTIINVIKSLPFLPIAPSRAHLFGYFPHNQCNPSPTLSHSHIQPVPITTGLLGHPSQPPSISPSDYLATQFSH